VKTVIRYPRQVYLSIQSSDGHNHNTDGAIRKPAAAERSFGLIQILQAE
jgi:hypothetical protein